MQQELLLFCVVWFLIGGIDDIAVDAIWIIRWCAHRLVFDNNISSMKIDKSLDVAKSYIFSNKDLGSPDFHAIFVSAWEEADVIGDMLQGCENAWRDSNVAHRIYVGCYPNDNPTIAQVIKAAQSNSNISVVLCSNDGPTTKADCLNHLWEAMLRDELNLGLKAKSIILHDAEDRPHPLSLTIFDTLIDSHDIVQLPVIPIMVPKSPFVSGHYCDEFCESHAKAMVVRESLGAALPLAGVGCAIDRKCLGRLAVKRHNLPFDADSVTEDYELGLRIGSKGRGAIMVRMHDDSGELIGTRSHFPNTMADAIKQKSRWTLGIALSGWDRLGWSRRVLHNVSVPVERRAYPPKQRRFELPFNLAENWMRMRDRKGIFSAFVISCAYFTVLLSLILFGAQYLEFHEIEPLTPMMNIMLFTTSSILIWRLVMRTLFLYHHYGFGQAYLALPRMIVSNVISILSARRAVMIYARYCFGKPMVWEKTRHHHIPIATDRVYHSRSNSRVRND